jgi:hypothetical protein
MLHKKKYSKASVCCDNADKIKLIFLANKVVQYCWMSQSPSSTSYFYKRVMARLGDSYVQN